MTNTQIGDFRTAGKRVRVEQMRAGRWWNGVRGEGDRHGGLAEMIQAMADEGYDCLGKINEDIPTGTFGHHTEDFLFVREV